MFLFGCIFFKGKNKPLVLFFFCFYGSKFLGEVMLCLDVCSYQKTKRKHMLGKVQQPKTSLMQAKVVPFSLVLYPVAGVML